MAVLESFDTERQRLNATLAAQRTGLTRAARGGTCSRWRIWAIWRRMAATSGWRQGVAVFGQFCSARLPRAAAHAEPAGGADAAVVLCRGVDGDEVVIVARSGVYGAPSRTMAYGLHLGARLPAHPTSTGRVLLAALPTAEFTQWLQGCMLQRLTPHTSRSAAPCARWWQVRRDDFCLAVEEQNWACMPWLCLCATCRGTRWRRSTWSHHPSRCRRKPCSATCCRCCRKPRARCVGCFSPSRPRSRRLMRPVAALP